MATAYPDLLLTRHSKSKLRKPSEPTLGKQYDGAAVSRATFDGDDGINDNPFALDNIESDDDPFSRVPEGSEGESDDAGLSREEDAENDAQSKAGEDTPMDSEHSSGETEYSDDASASSGSASSRAFSQTKPASSDRAALKAILANDTAAIASTLSAAAASDAKKGRAVRQQYQTLDRLVDARIKLQKALTSLSSLSDASTSSTENAPEVARVEAAAVGLWSTLESIRYALIASHSKDTNSKKRKHPSPATSATTTADLWSRSQSLETQSLAHRRAILDKWSAKVRAASAVPTARPTLVDRSSDPTRVTAVLDTYLTSESERLVKEATSNPPPTTANAPSTTTTTKPTPAPPPTFHDDAFYTSLLRDLISSRSDAAILSSSPNNNPLPPLGPRPPRRHRPGVDTKASKGRQIRYTVHERLQNFAAPEPRATWSEAAATDFFASLLGGSRTVLEEDDEEGEHGPGVSREAEALRLFGN